MDKNKNKDPLISLDTRLKKARELVQDPLTRTTEERSEKGLFSGIDSYIDLRESHKFIISTKFGIVLFVFFL